LKDVTPETAPRIAEGLRDAINTGELSHADIVSYSEIVGVEVPSAYALADISIMDPTVKTIDASKFMELRDLHGDKDYNRRVSTAASLLRAAVKRGGGTFDVGTMNNVTSGYAVARNKSGIRLDTKPMTKAIRALNKGKLSAADKKAIDKAEQTIFAILLKNKEELGISPEEGVTTTAGAWIKTARTPTKKGDELEEVLELHFEISDVYDKDKYSEEDVIEIAKQERQEGIMDLDQVDSGDIEGAFIPTGFEGTADYLDTDEVLEESKEEWDKAKKEAAEKAALEEKTRMDSISDLLMETGDDGPENVIRQLRMAADPNDPFKYQKGVQDDIRTVEQEIEKLEIMKKNFERSYPEGEGKDLILAEFDRILAEKRSGEVQERRPTRRDEDEDQAQALQERLQAAAPRQEVVVPDPIDAEMDDVEFEQAINNLRDPIKNSALVDTEGKAIVDEEGNPTFDLGFDKEELDKANEKVKGVTDKLVNDLIEDLKIPLQGAELLVNPEDGTPRTDLDKSDQRELRRLETNRRVAVRIALQNAVNKISIINLPEKEEQIEEIEEQGNQAVEDLTDDE